MRELEHIKNIEYSVNFCYNFNHSQVASTLRVSDCEIKKQHIEFIILISKVYHEWFFVQDDTKGPGNITLPGPFCVSKRVVGQISIYLFEFFMISGH